MHDVALLKSINLFAQLDQKHLKAIIKNCTERKFEAGSFLIEQGLPGIGLFIIVEGTVTIIKTIKDGTQVKITQKGPGDVIGEMSVLDGALRTASVRAETPVTCLVLSAWSFKALMESHPEVALGVLPVVVQRFRETNDALLELSRAHDISV